MTARGLFRSAARKIPSACRSSTPMSAPRGPRVVRPSTRVFSPVLEEEIVVVAVTGMTGDCTLADADQILHGVLIARSGTVEQVSGFTSIHGLSPT